MDRETRASGSVAGSLPTPGALASLTLLLLVLAAGCTFERRPRARADQDTGGVGVAPPRESTSSPPGESAAAFLERFLETRERGSAEELESLIRPGATAMIDGRVRDFREMGVPGEVDDGAEPRVADSEVAAAAAFFVIRYGPSVETILLTRDSAGWGLRFLHRVTGDAGDPGGP